MQIVIIRPPLVYGPSVRANFRALLSAVMSGIPLPLAAARNRRSMIFVGNLSSLVIATAFSTRVLPKVLLASDGHDMAMRDFLKLLATALGRPSRLFPVPAGLALFGANLLGKGAAAARLFGSLEVDVSETRTALGWDPPYSIEDGIELTAKAFLSE